MSGGAIRTTGQQGGGTNTPKLTPGPLFVRSWFDHSDTTIGYIDADDRFVPVADCGVGAELTEREPLARVLAAGPVLLEALRGVLRVADRNTAEFDAARAAILKATGSTS